MVDTPGFDDSRPNMSDPKLLGDIAHFLEERYVLRLFLIIACDNSNLDLKNTIERPCTVLFSFTASATSALVAPQHATFACFLLFVDPKP